MRLNSVSRLRETVIVTAVVALILLSGACRETKKTETGIIFSHANHIERGFDCDTCHQYSEDQKPKRAGMDICEVCHDFDMDKPDERCKYCHTRDDYSITPIAKPGYADVKFAHEVHLENKLECVACHAGISASHRVSADMVPTMTENCMPCHEQRAPEATECSKCHKTISKDVKPTFQAGRDVDHSDEAQWLRHHGLEYQFDKDYCQLCHPQESWCVSCHQITPPRDHNNIWRRRTHGLEAAWNRNRCMTCHQQDFCQRCHENTTPRSHSGGWNTGQRRHCVACHFPLGSTECRVCHEKALHESAGLSPHPVVFPPACSACHPGLPGIPPHHSNSTISCRGCHR